MKTIILLLVVIFTAPDISSQHTITFAVDLTKPAACGLFTPQAGDSIILRGTFNDWAGNDLVLRDEDHDLLYKGTFQVEGDSGSVVEFKYLIKKANSQALWEKRPNPKNKPHGSRQLTLTGKDIELQPSAFDFDRYYLAAIGKEVLFSTAEMQADFQEFRKTLELEHCCLYDYTSKAGFDSLFDHQYNLIEGPMPPNEFYKILTPLTARVGCGHTAVWMPGGYWDIGPEKLFPLQVRIMTGKTIKFKAVEEYLLVVGTYTDSIQIPIGSMIQEINGFTASEIIHEMRQNYAADAFNPYFIDSQIDRRFPLIFARRFGFYGEYTVKYALPGRKTSETRTIQPAKNPDVRKVIFSHFHHPPLGFEILVEYQAAVMTIPTFIYYDRVPWFTGFLDSCFAVIREKNIANLILDLRGNDGGDPFCAAPLFSYLQHEPLPYFAAPYGKYADLAEPLPLPEDHFTGHLITLMDGRCFSTNAHLCALLKYHQIGTFVGTPSGATYTCNAGKNTQKRLKNTGIQLYFGRSSFAAAVEGMDKTRPIYPDYYIKESYNDFLEGKDACMHKALQLIDEQNKKRL
jgi:hypothetical protein